MSAGIPHRVLLLGLDGASLAVVGPLAAAGRLPNLARWMRDGVASPLLSTTPAMSFPAWSTLATGLEPGAHGLFDFTQKIAGAYRIRFVNASDRCGKTVFARASQAGARVLCLGMPATFPPEPLNGLQVSGFDAPVSSGTDASSASDPTLYREIATRVGPWMRPELDESGRDADFHEHAIEVLLRRIDRKTGFALESLRRLGIGRAARSAGSELVCVVFSESDTAQHHYWRDFDSGSPRHDPAASARRRDAIPAVYEALDAACGRLVDAMGEGAHVLIVSDHGAGSASDQVVHLNARLAECGLLTRMPVRFGATGDAAARAARDFALRILPQSLVQRVFRRASGTAARVESLARFGGMAWPRTTAFSEEANTQPGVWLNLRGREASGRVASQDAVRATRDVIDALLDWKLPNGGRVIARALPREEIYQGVCRERAPDIVVELALDGAHGLSLVPTPWRDGGGSALRRLGAEEYAGGRGRGMNGVHRPEGLCIATTRESAAAFGWPPNEDLASITEIAPALLRALGVATGFTDGLGRRAGDGPETARRRSYSAEEEALVAARLRALGYLD